MIGNQVEYFDGGLLQILLLLFLILLLFYSAKIGAQID